MSRVCRSKLPIKADLLIPKIVRGVKDKLKEKQIISKKYYNKNIKKRENMKPGDNVVVRKNNVWEPAKIIKADKTPRSFWIRNEDNRVLRRNTSHLRRSKNSPNINESSNFDIDLYINKTINPAVSNDLSDGGVPIMSNSTLIKTSRFGRVLKSPKRFVSK